MLQGSGPTTLPATGVPQIYLQHLSEPLRVRIQKGISEKRGLHMVERVKFYQDRLAAEGRIYLAIEYRR